MVAKWNYIDEFIINYIYIAKFIRKSEYLYNKTKKKSEKSAKKHNFGQIIKFFLSKTSKSSFNILHAYVTKDDEYNYKKKFLIGHRPRVLIISNMVNLAYNIPSKIN